MKIKSSILLLLIFISVLTESVSANRADSLTQVYKNSSGKNRIELALQIISAIQRTNPQEAAVFGNEAIRLLEKFPDKKLEIEVMNANAWAYLYKNDIDSAIHFSDLTGDLAERYNIKKGLILKTLVIGRVLRNQGLYQEAIDTLESAVDINIVVDDPILQVKLFNELGSVHRRLSNHSEALSYHIQAHEILKEYPDAEELMTTLTFLGITNDILGNYDKALNFHQQSLELNKKHNDIRGMAGSVHNIGILYQKLDDYSQALYYYDQARKLWEELNNQGGLAATLNSIGAIHELQNNYEEALKYYKQAFAIWKKSGSQYSLSIAYHNIASANAGLSDFNEAKENIQQAIAIRKKLGDKAGTSSSIIVLSRIYNQIGNADSAIFYGREGLKLAQETGGLTSLKAAYHTLSEIYEENGLLINALQEYKNYKAVHDSIFNLERQSVIDELETKYKSEEKEQQIKILQKETEIQDLYRIVLISGLFLVLLILGLLYNRFRLKKRAHETQIKLHQTEVETANLRTEAAENKAAVLQVEYDLKRKELEAARELQLSMLPSEMPKLKNASIAAHMETATEVGGDYYDFFIGDDESLTIFLGDATGHGAQAGIMVTATKSIFHLFSCKHDLVEILNRTNAGIKNIKLSNLFMSAALLRLKGNVLEYAGAGMPPAFLYRAAHDNIEELSLKGSPLGNSLEYHYTKSETILHPGDLLLLMSDGFPELFNSKMEMLDYEIIPELLKKNARKLPEEIISEFNDKASEWLNGVKQQDDMTFVVLKYTG
ncbi:MAG: tetratricopeptide repeat protein [Ignavibacteriaceae bacterium]